MRGLFLPCEEREPIGERRHRAAEQHRDDEHRSTLSARGILFVTEAENFRPQTAAKLRATFEHQHAHPRPYLVFLEGFEPEHV